MQFSIILTRGRYNRARIYSQDSENGDNVEKIQMSGTTESKIYHDELCVTVIPENIIEAKALFA
jgi:hypothetical protein